MSSIYDVMLQLPIFQGLSKIQLDGIVEKIPFDFCQFAPGQTILEMGDICDNVQFLLNGTVQQITSTYGGRIRILQNFEGPHTLPFYYLFGAETRSISQLVAIDQVGLMRVDKSSFLHMLQQNNVMLVNVMNMLSTNAQKQHVAMEFTAQTDPVLRLASWLLAYTDRKAIDIRIQASEPAWQTLLRLDGGSFGRHVAMLEGRGCLELENGILKLTDRYALRRFVVEKTTPNQ